MHNSANNAKKSSFTYKMRTDIAKTSWIRARRQHTCKNLFEKRQVTRYNTYPLFHICKV